jgi:holo-[acyl-carrier protein] synthase
MATLPSVGHTLARKRSANFRPSMLFHGVDIVETARISRAVSRWGDRFLRRVWTPGELRDANSRIPSLAARFAAKEAAAKALGVGLRGFGAIAQAAPDAIGLQEIEVIRLPNGRPELQLHGRAARRAAELGWHSVALSLSHTADMALASVVALSHSSAPSLY